MPPNIQKMDFRDITIDRVKFNAPIRRGTSLNSKATYGAGKIIFQLPRCYARISENPKFPGALDMVLSGASLRDVGAVAFLAQLRDRADETSVLTEHIFEKDFYDPMRKLTAFDETPIFDADGEIMKNVPDLYGSTHEVSLLVSLDGAWISERSWGMRVRVSQVKVHRQRVVPPPLKLEFQKSAQRTGPRQGFMFQDEDSSKTGPRQGFMFQDEDSTNPVKKSTTFAFLED